MHKWTILTVLLVAIVAASNGQGRRGRLFRMNRPLSSPFRIPRQRQVIAAAPSYGGFRPSPYNMPPMAMMPRYPDGEYHTPHGTTTIDGSDISFDSNSDFMMVNPMMG